MKALFLTIAVAAFGLLINTSYAEEIKIPVGAQSPELNKVARPTMGMSKASVRSQYGEPNKENPAKGKPSISNWEYPEFIVYFENDHVIHSVLKAKIHETEEIILEDTDEMREDDLKLKAN